MAVPANFPFVVASLGNPSPFAIVNPATLEYSTSVRHQIVPDFVNFILKAYISTNNGQTWTFVANGPAISSDASLIYQVVSGVPDTTNKILYTLYWTPGDTIAIVPFVATGTGGAFGTAQDSGVGYQAGTDQNAGESSQILLGEYRPADNSVWVAFENGRTPSNYQAVQGMKYLCTTETWDSQVALSNQDTTQVESALAANGYDPTSGNIYFLIYDYRVASPKNSQNVRMVTISPTDGVSVSLIKNFTTSVLFVTSNTIGIDASGNLMVTFTSAPNIANNYWLAVGKPGSFTLSQPAFLQPLTGFGNTANPAFYNGTWNVFYKTDDGTTSTFYNAQSADAVNWTTSSYASYGAADPLGDNLAPVFPQMFSNKIVQNIPINDGSSISGAAYWEVSSGPAPPPGNTPLVKNFTPTGVNILPDPRVICRHCRQIRCKCISTLKNPIQSDKVLLCPW